MLRESKGNMYTFVTHTWNPIKGRCPHDCEYCYVKINPNLGELRLVENELKTNLGGDKFIFVGSGCDIFAEKVPAEWIYKALEHCQRFPKNKYLFQSKNPSRIIDFGGYLPHDIIIGTTIETNRDYSQMGKSPSTKERAEALS